MNEYNHHRIIGKFVKDKSGIDVQTLEDASDFSDDFRGILNTELAEDPKGVLKDTAIDMAYKATNPTLSSAELSAVVSGGNPIAIAIGTGTGAFLSMTHALKNNENVVEAINESQYYYYHFFYEIHVEKNAGKNANGHGTGKITLIRNNHNSYINPNAFLKKEDLGKYAEKYSDNPKLYFTAVNDREKYFLSGKIKTITEGSNQSNCVAFLHAMGSKTIHEKFNENNPRHTFEEHLNKCFAEYLFLTDETEALFMLGIALHGIMDSFTPSHTGFQVYDDQDMALHAQGDVIPIQDDKEPERMGFIPGQIKEEAKTKPIMRYLAELKGYNDDEFLNDHEYEMLRSYLIICKVAYKKNNTELDINEINDLCAHFKKHRVSLSKINVVLSEGFTYGKNAFDYSIKAVRVLNEIYKILSTKRN